MLRTITNSTPSPLIPTNLILPITIGGVLLLLFIISITIYCICKQRTVNIQPTSELETSLLTNNTPATIYSGYLDKTGRKSSLQQETFTRHYFSLCGQTTLSFLKDTLYYFENEEQSNAFFTPNNRSNNSNRIQKPTGIIHLKEVTRIRYSSRTDLPENGRGLELHTSQRIWLICCSDGDEIFDTWVAHLSKASNKKPKRFTSKQESKSGKKKKTRRPSRSGRSRRHSRSSSFSSDISIDENEDVVESAPPSNNYLPDVDINGGGCVIFEKQ